MLASVLFGGLYWATVRYAQRQLRQIAGDATALASDTGCRAAANWSARLPAAWPCRATPVGTRWSARRARRVGNLSPGLLAPGWHELSVPTPQENHPPPCWCRCCPSPTATAWRWAADSQAARAGGILRRRVRLGAVAGRAGELGGALAVGRAVNRRTSVLHAVTAAVEAGDLDQRVALSPRGDEFDLIGRDVNDMLDHIGRLLQRLRQVSLDVAHDLRTAVAPAPAPGQPAAARSDAAAHPGRGTARHGRSRCRAGHIRRPAAPGAAGRRLVARGLPRRRPGGLLHNLAEVYARWRTTRGRAFAAEVAPGLVVHGDRELLVQMLVNVIENAIRHTPPGTRVTLRARRRRCRPDAGGDRRRSRHRRSRPPRARRAAAAGAAGLQPRWRGLGHGLALAKAIAELHDGRLELRDAAPGLCVHTSPGAATRRAGGAPATA